MCRTGGTSALGFRMCALKEEITGRRRTTLKEGITSRRGNHFKRREGINVRRETTLREGITGRRETTLKEGIIHRRGITKGLLAEGCKLRQQLTNTRIPHTMLHCALPFFLCLAEERRK